LVRALRAAGLDLFARGVGNFKYDDARDAAIFVCNGHIAFAVMDVVRYEFGLSVPGDVSVADLKTCRPLPGPPAI
jgi:DNA-binding LacI/PurR family transcriptional regulator